MGCGKLRIVNPVLNPSLHINNQHGFLVYLFAMTMLVFYNFMVSRKCSEWYQIDV